MSTPTDSVAPPYPTGTSSPWPMPAWWKRIADWLAALSPSGADKYDTGWQSIEPSSGFAASSIHVRRIGKLVVLRISNLTRASGSGTATAFVIPPGFRPTEEHYPAWSSPSPNHTTWITTGGEVRGGFTTTGNTYRATTVYPVA